MKANINSSMTEIGSKPMSKNPIIILSKETRLFEEKSPSKIKSRIKQFFKKLFHIHDWKYSCYDHDYLQRYCKSKGCDKHQFKMYGQWYNFPN